MVKFFELDGHSSLLGVLPAIASSLGLVQCPSCPLALEDQMGLHQAATSSGLSISIGWSSWDLAFVGSFLTVPVGVVVLLLAGIVGAFSKQEEE